MLVCHGWHTGVFFICQKIIAKAGFEWHKLEDGAVYAIISGTVDYWKLD